jgi:hypothetical protein
MHISRLLVFLLLIPACVAPVAAQFSPDKSPVSAQPKLDGLVAPPEFRPHVLPLRPTLPPREPARNRAIQPQLSFDSTLEQDDTACYSIRSYRVTRDDPESDSTRLAGYSECQPAARFQVKAAVESEKVELR